MNPRTPAELDEFVRRNYAPEHWVAKRDQWADFFGIVTAEQKAVCAAWDKAERRAAQEQAQFEEQARFDAQYQARRQQQADRAIAERELERQAAKDAPWMLPGKPRRHLPNSKRHTTDRAQTAPQCGHVHETFALAGRPNCAELGRSELDLLGDLVVPMVGFRANAHARRRAFFARIGASSRPVSLARAA